MITKANNSLNFLVTIFTFSVSIFFIYYFLENSKIIYLIVSLLVYVLSFLSRKHLKLMGNKSYTEPGLFFMSISLTGYSAYLLNLEPSIINIIKEELVVPSLYALAAFLVLHYVSSFKNNKNKYVITGMIFILAALVFYFEKELTSMLITNEMLINLFLGTPVVYLISILFPIHEVFIKYRIQ